LRFHTGLKGLGVAADGDSSIIASPAGRPVNELRVLR